VLTARPLPQDDLLADVQELARQRLSADERAVLAATVPEATQRHLLDDTSYALQVGFSGSYHPPCVDNYYSDGHEPENSLKAAKL